MENQRKCIEQFNEMIEKEEKRSGKFFNENDKENMFKDLLNKLYKENQKNKLINNFSNLNEDEKISDGNTNYNNNFNLCFTRNLYLSFVRANHLVNLCFTSR